MAPPESYRFGVELELIGRLRKIRHQLVEAASLRDRCDWLEKLAVSLRSLDVEAVADRFNERYRKHPEHYDKWWITKDGSLDPQFAHIPLEAVSPILSTRLHWEEDIVQFWSAWLEVFAVPDWSSSCGTHIHISPWPKRSFTIRQLRLVAFGVALYEPLIQQLLPRHRRDNKYCQRNTRYSTRLKKLTRLRERDGGGHDVWDLFDVAYELEDIDDKEELRSFMQGKSKPSADRHVLWNFDNILRGQSGTIEFRGGPGVRDSKTTKMWISFVVAFVHLCLHQRLSKFYNFPEPTMERFWSSLLEVADDVMVRENLPDDWEDMAKK